MFWALGFRVFRVLGLGFRASWGFKVCVGSGAWGILGFWGSGLGYRVVGQVSLCVCVHIHMCICILICMPRQEDRWINRWIIAVIYTLQILKSSVRYHLRGRSWDPLTQYERGLGFESARKTLNIYIEFKF